VVTGRRRDQRLVAGRLRRAEKDGERLELRQTRLGGSLELVQLGDECLSKGLAREVGEDGAAPEGQRVPQSLFTLGGRPTVRAVDEDAKAVDVDLSRPESQAPTTPYLLEHLSAECAPELEDARPDFAPRSRPPDHSDQLVERHGPPGLEQKACQKDPVVSTAQLDDPRVVEDLQRPEDPKVEHRLEPWRGRLTGH
jgi:hypothetical protein